MRIVSFNVNGIRARPHQLEALRDQYDPDVIGLQEIKVQDADFPLEMIGDLGYHVQFYGQKAHYGVALLSKKPPIEVIMGLPGDTDDTQKRMISGIYETPLGNRLTVMNGYYPQGESRDHETKFPHKRAFYAELSQWLGHDFSPGDNLMLIGDMNIAADDKDIGIGADNARRWLRTGKCSFLPEEREWLETLKQWGLHDTWRNQHPDVDDQFSWFDYRSKGFNREPKRGLRIDLLLGTEAVNQKVTDSGIAYDIRAMEKPSDHCPIWVDLDL